MDVTPDIPEGRQLIQAHREGGFRISGMVHDGSVLVLPDQTFAWAPTQFAAVTLESLAPIQRAEAGIDLLILGSGRRFAMAPPALRADLRALGIMVESMDTRAACRTYNVLLAEDRRVAAALIAL